MRGWGKWAAIAGAALLTGVPIFAEGPCANKPVDPCGCHHVHGIRHCHPNRRTKYCVATVKGKLPAPVLTTTRTVL
jgi:hypothetical protein